MKSIILFIYELPINIYYLIEDTISYFLYRNIPNRDKNNAEIVDLINIIKIINISNDNYLRIEISIYQNIITKKQIYRGEFYYENEVIQCTKIDDYYELYFKSTIMKFSSEEAEFIKEEFLEEFNLWYIFY